MKINVQTFIKTNRDVSDVFSHFNEKMFRYLTSYAPVKALRYDGDEVGSQIHLQMLLPWKDLWVSVITERNLNEKECYFIDVGEKLPFNILKWQHKHILRKAESGVIIEDDIRFESSNWFFNQFWWFIFVSQFLVRKIQYQKYLKNRL